MSARPPPSALAVHWAHDPSVVYLNHGAFGSAPRAVLSYQAELQARLERDAMQLFMRDLEGLLDEARAALAAFVGADAEGLAFVDNATTGVNTVLRSLDFAAGDELLTTSHAYGACLNALRYVAGRSGARVVVADVPFPLRGPDDVAGPVLAAVTERTRLVLLDHVTSPTGVVFPVETLVPELQARGIDVLVDGAHAPGMLPLDLSRLGAAYYTGNCHKWICAPKGAAFLHVRADRRDRIHPLTISHGASSRRTDRSRFRLEFDFGGTKDPSPWLSVPRAIAVVGSLVPGGWDEVRARNAALTRTARALVTDALGTAPPCPEAMLGSLAAVPLPPGGPAGTASMLSIDPLQEALWQRHRIQVPVYAWPEPSRRWIRVSPALHNSEAQYVFLAGALREALRTG